MLLSDSLQGMFMVPLSYFDRFGLARFLLYGTIKSHASLCPKLRIAESHTLKYVPWMTNF